MAESASGHEPRTRQSDRSVLCSQGLRLLPKSVRDSERPRLPDAAYLASGAGRSRAGLKSAPTVSTGATLSLDPSRALLPVKQLRRATQ
jgi:hypothetical protein